MPIRIIQWYLETVHQLHLSVGAIVQAVHGVARQAETAVREVLEQVRASPVVQGDETGWRQDGSNGARCSDRRLLPIIRLDRLWRSDSAILHNDVNYSVISH